MSDESKPDRDRDDSRDGRKPSDAGSGSRKPYERNGSGAKKPYEKKPYEKKPYEKKPYDRSGSSDRKPYDRNAKPGERKPYDRSAKPGESKPYEKKPYDRSGSSDRKPYDRNAKPGERKPYDRNAKPGERKPYDRNAKPGESKPYEKKPYDRSGSSDRKPYDRNAKPGERKPYEKKPYDRSGSSDRKPYDRNAKPGESKPYEKKPYDRSGSSDRKPYDRAGGGRPASERPPRDEDARPRHDDPPIPEDVEANQLDKGARIQLKTLSKENGEGVAKHLVMVGRLIDSDPALAHRHALAATRRAGRIGVVRETAAITAYATGDFALALRELRTYRRITGREDQLPLMVDSERGVGRPQAALELGRSVPRDSLDASVQVALAIAMSGARLDLGQAEQALTELQIAQLDPERAFEYSPALFDAYATVLEELGRDEEAEQWWQRSDRASIALEQASIPEGQDTVEIIEEFLDDDDVDDDDDDVDAGEVPAPEAPAGDDDA
jgi:hypothetical protein